MDKYGYSFCRGRIFETVEQDKGQYSTGGIFWAGGACGLIRRTAYWEIQGMYDYYFMHFEEVDLCWRFHRAGYKVFCHAGSKVYHVGGGTLSYQSPRKTFYNFRNNLVMLWRNSGPSYRMAVFPVRFVLDGGAAFRFLLAGDFRNSWAVVKGYYAFFYYLLIVNDHQSSNLPKPNLNTISTVYNGSVVWNYFLKGRKMFSSYKF